MTARKHEAHMSNDKRIAILETTLLNINTTLVDIKQDIRRQTDRIETLDKKIDNKFDTLNSQIWSNFLWLIGMIIGLAGLIAHTQHWV